MLKYHHPVPRFSAHAHGAAHPRAFALAVESRVLAAVGPRNPIADMVLAAGLFSASDMRGDHPLDHCPATPSTAGACCYRE